MISFFLNFQSLVIPLSFFYVVGFLTMSCNSCGPIPDLLRVWLTIISLWPYRLCLPVNQCECWLLQPLISKHKTVYSPCSVGMEEGLWRSPVRTAIILLVCDGCPWPRMLENSLLLTLILFCMKDELLINADQICSNYILHPIWHIKSPLKNKVIKRGLLSHSPTHNRSRAFIYDLNTYYIIQNSFKSD